MTGRWRGALLSALHETRSVPASAAERFRARLLLARTLARLGESDAALGEVAGLRADLLRVVRDEAARRRRARRRGERGLLGGGARGRSPEARHPRLALPVARRSRLALRGGDPAAAAPRPAAPGAGRGRQSPRPRPGHRRVADVHAGGRVRGSHRGRGPPGPGVQRQRRGGRPRRGPGGGGRGRADRRRQPDDAPPRERPRTPPPHPRPHRRPRGLLGMGRPREGGVPVRAVGSLSRAGGASPAERGAPHRAASRRTSGRGRGPAGSPRLRCGGPAHLPPGARFRLPRTRGRGLRRPWATS